jgi:hypothetical protein
MSDRRHPYRKPDQQGKFDGLCGVYAILNSIKWLYRLSEDDLDTMFEKLCESLPDKFPKALWDGLGVPEVVRLLKFSEVYLSNRHRHGDFRWHLPFTRRRFGSPQSFWEEVGKQIKVNALAVLIVGLNKPWNHWTVARRITTATVELYDSYGMRRYPFKSFTLNKTKAGDGSGLKIMIDTHQSFRVTRCE